MTSSGLDLPAAILTGIFAGSLFHIHAISHPKRDNWLTLPAYVRRGLFISGAMLTWRAVNFASIADSDPLGVGHINAEGMMALVSLTYTFTALALWLSRRQLRNHGWSRLNWVERMMRRDPQQAPVMMSLQEVADTHKALGAEIAAGPGEATPDARRRLH